MHKEVKRIMYKELEEIMRVMSHPTEIINKYKWLFFLRSQIEILDFQRTITELQFLLEGLTIRCDQAEDRIHILKPGQEIWTRLRRVDSLEKTLMLGGTGGRRRRGWQDEMAGWHHRLDRRESEWTPGVGDGQGGLACCDSWGRKESDTTERLNWTEEHKEEREEKWAVTKRLPGHSSHRTRA